MTIVALVIGAAILLTLMLAHSYSREGSYNTKRRTRRDGGDGGNAWMFAGDGGGSDCSAGDGGGCGGDGGGGGD